MICIILLTYNRLAVAKRCLLSVAKNLKASEEFWMHIADDGSTQDYRDELAELARSLYGGNVSITNSQRTGYGGNYNTATQVVHRIADLMLPLEDDWELVRELNLDPIAAVLRAGIFGCVRMAYIGITQELRGRFVSAEGLQWLELDPDSPEPHVFTGGPRLERVDWERAVGPWMERQDQGVTELEITQRPASRFGVAWPVDLIFPRGDAFAHIGSVKADLQGIEIAQPVGAGA